MSDTCDRVEKLVAGRRAGNISLRQFKAQIEKFTSGELACLAATLLETSPGKRNRLERGLRKYSEEARHYLAFVSRNRPQRRTTREGGDLASFLSLRPAMFRFRVVDRYAKDLSI